eukprot:scpid102493/ scgid13378/ 
MVAARRGTRNAAHYTGLVQSRVTGKDNSLQKEHVDAHFAFAQVKYVKEFCQHFEAECVQLSCDDMNKVNVGVLAVSRYHQLNHFFPVDDKPQYSDHDFPYKYSSIRVSFISYNPHAKSLKQTWYKPQLNRLAAIFQR